MAIDPITASVLLGVALNVASDSLESLLASSSRKIRDLIVGEHFLEKREAGKAAILPILEQAATKISECEDWLVEQNQGFEIASGFIKSVEVEELLRQIYAVQLENQKPDHLDAIRRSFVTLLIQRFAEYPSDYTPYQDQLQGAANLLFEALLSECNNLLDYAIDQGILAAHEAREAFRHNLLSSQIAAIQTEVEFLTSTQKIERHAICEFERRYREQVGRQYSKITPPNTGIEDRRPIDDLYVTPGIKKKAKTKDLPEDLQDGFQSGIAAALNKVTGQPINRIEFLASIHCAVLLGNPGAGKSTFTAKLCYDLANSYTERLLAGKMALTPIPVILRKYAVEKNKHGYTILEFIEKEAKTLYQLTDVPYHAFQYLLHQGQMAVIFDGLDELLDTSEREEIRNNVEHFCRLYPSIPVLVTSREVGYEQAPLDEELFETFQLQEFDDPQIQEYVYKWFRIDETGSLTAEQRHARAAKFLEESKHALELRKNPLMLALLCSIYREENYIPQNRPDVYKKCTFMLYEKWDKKRGLYKPPLSEAHVRPLIEHLAYWIYKDTNLRAGVTASELTKETTTYLHDLIYEDIYEARRVAYEFVNFCTDRAWVFTDTGTKRDGEKLYQFVHATFLEYFAASRLVSECQTPTALLQVLKPRISKREWDVMAQLAFQLYSEKNVGSADILLTSLTKQSIRSIDKPNWNLLSFAARCLQFIVPRPETRRLIARTFLDACASYDLNTKLPTLEGPYGIISNLENSIPDNIKTIAGYLQKLIIQRINEEPEGMILRYIDIVFSPSSKDLFISKNIFSECENRLKEFFPKSLLLCNFALLEGILDICEFIKFHNFIGLFTFMRPDVIKVRYPPIAYIILYSIESGSDSSNAKVGRDLLTKIGKLLYASTYPYLSIRKFLDEAAHLIPINHMATIEVKNQPTDVLLGAFFYISIELELYIIELTLLNRAIVENRLRADSHPLSLYNLALARFTPEIIPEVQPILDECCFSADQQTFIWHWIRKEIHFVEESASLNLPTNIVNMQKISKKI